MKKLLLTTCLSLLVNCEGHTVTAKEVFADNHDYVMLNGVKTRKGTIATTYRNSFELDHLLKDKGNDPAEALKIIDDQRSISAGLYASEISKIIPLEIWLKNLNRQGRIMVAVLILQNVPGSISPEIKRQLKQIKQTAHPILQEEINKLKI